MSCTLVDVVSDFSRFNPTLAFNQVIFARGIAALAAVPGLLPHLKSSAFLSDIVKAAVWTPDRTLRFVERGTWALATNPI